MCSVAPFAATIVMSPNAGDLNIESSSFASLNERRQPVILHNGAVGSKVNIVSSRFYEAGGFDIYGAGETNIVNSIWANKDFEDPNSGDRIVNRSSGDMNIIASSIMWNSNTCNQLCVTHHV